MTEPDTPEQTPSDLERERALLIEALTNALGGSVKPDLGQESAPSKPGKGEEGAAFSPGQGEAAAASPGDDGRIPLQGPGHDENPGSGDPTEEGSTVGCACCGCRAPRTCAVCPVCRGAATALDPSVLERVADVAALLAEGLRAAARRLATEERDGR